jgi:mannose-6-phosphate isomerase-like protein (cupin superfamily)
MVVKTIQPSKLKSIAYYTLSKLEEWNLLGHNVKDFNYTNYHNFDKAFVPQWWYEDILELLELCPDDVLVEVAKVKGDHKKDLHYHKIAQAFCIILGEGVGVNKCDDGWVQINDQLFPSEEDAGFYFPQVSHHTFYGGKTNDLYFLSVQNPPLLTKNKDDFYLVNNG